MDSVTEENIAKIMAEKDKKLAELSGLKVTTEQQLWLNELSTLKSEYTKYIVSLQQTSTEKPVIKKKKKVVKA